MASIIHVPNTILTTPSQEITDFGKPLTKLIDTMKSAFYAATRPKGVGLAAPQIGVPYRVFITRPSEKDAIRVFVNPSITKAKDVLFKKDGDKSDMLEGCLSIPHVWGQLKRSSMVTLRFQDEHGSLHEESFKRFMATIIQHETDHVNGILFTRRALEQKGKLFQIVRDEHGKEVLEEIHIR